MMWVDVSRTRSAHSFSHKALRAIWGVVWLVLFLPSPRPLHGWRSFLLRLFGARIGKAVHVYPSAKVWAPWNLEMGDHACLSHHVDCYCVDRIAIGAHATVSQYSYLCGASHDYRVPDMPLTPRPIVIGAGAWVAADAFISPGVTVGEGAVVGARATVVADVAPWTVVAGNPARFLKQRERRSAPDAG